MADRLVLPMSVHAPLSARVRRAGFRGSCILLVLAPLVAVEVYLRARAVPAQASGRDPFVEMVQPGPLFERSPDGARYQVREDRRFYFRPQTFAAEKPPGTLRVFVLGGSTVQGRPYSVETAFPAWLKLALEAADPDRAWEVVNCGGVSYASYRLRPILDEVLGLDPDLVVLCTGHNEFLEARTYARVLGLPGWLRRVYAGLNRLEVFAAARRGWERRTGATPALPGEVEARLDRPGALAGYTRDDRHRRAVLAHFEASIEAMVATTRDAGVPMILVTPPSNLLDTSPFKSAFDPPTPDKERVWETIRAGIEDPALEIRQLEDLAALDGRHAGVQFRLGRSLVLRHRYGPARAALVQAKDEDLCPLRIQEPQREALARIALRYRVPLLDAHALLERGSPQGILGDDGLLDHVHPHIDGHRQIAAALVETMTEAGLVEPRPGWRDAWDSRAAAHLAGLSPSYFAQGQMRLERLRRWVRDPAPIPPVE